MLFYGPVALALMPQNLIALFLSPLPSWQRTNLEICLPSCASLIWPSFVTIGTKEVPIWIHGYGIIGRGQYCIFIWKFAFLHVPL